MNEISDEMLMAFADGELEDTDRARVEAYLRSSDDGVRRLEVFAATGRGLADWFDQPMHEPVPQHLLDAVTAAPVVRFDAAKQFRRRWPSDSLQRAPYMALAASLTVIAVGAGSFLLTEGPVSTDDTYGIVASMNGEQVAAAALSGALETVASGMKVEAILSGSPATIEPVFTFANADNRYCRQYVITRSPDSAFGGVACRMQAGQWRVEAHEAFTPKANNENRIVPAGKDDLPGVDTVVDRLIVGDVLSSDAEASVIANGWHASAP